jgi:HK97 family phage prohead protease
MTGSEYKSVPCELRAVEPDGSFAGYASRFDVVDLGRDLVLPGAFTDSIARRGARGVRMLFQHDPAEPIGVWTALAEDAHGLYARGRILAEVARGREVLALMRAGAIDGLSIGFRTVEGRTDPKSGIRRLSRIDLWEISVVTFPMLPEARVAAVKQQADLRLAAAIRRAAAVFHPHPHRRAAAKAARPGDPDWMAGS